MAKLVVYTGPMFSNKTTRLISALLTSSYAKKIAIAFKPRLDTRTGSFIAARALNPRTKKFRTIMRFPAYPVASLDEMRAVLERKRPAIIGIDEAQFFDPWLAAHVAALLNEHAGDDFEIHVSGLDMDYRRVPFGSMPLLMAMADEVCKTTAVCFVCGKPALFTQRLIASTEQILVGDKGEYDSRCRRCHYIPQ